MSIAGEIERINLGLGSAYSAIRNLGGVVEDNPTVDNLESYILSIPIGIKMTTGNINGFNYERYEDGRIHIWGTVMFTPSSSTKSNNMWYSNQYNEPLGFDEFNLTDCCVSLSCANRYYIPVSCGVEEGNLYFRVVCGTASINTSLTNTVYVNIWGMCS